MEKQTSRRQIILGLLALLGLVVLVLMPQPLPAHLLKFDFQAYWGASYLLGHSQNFSDPDLLFQVQRTFAGRQDEMAQMTWNPPWLLVLFLPFTWLPFAKASWLWFLTNIGLLFTSVVLLWNLFATQEKTRRLVWLGLLVAFAFVPTLATILVGQITTLVLLGLSGFLFLMARERLDVSSPTRPFSAGLLLSLTTIKPHLVYITLPLITLELVRRKQWRAIAGLLLFPVLGTMITFGLRPSFLPEYVANLTNNGLVGYSVPTIAYLLADLLNWSGFRLMGVVILPLAIIWWWRQKQPVDLANWTAATLLLSVITAPFGWSFDMVILLLPILRLLVWMVEKQVNRPYIGAAIILFAAVNGLILYVRTLPVEDGQFFWIAPAIALLYAWGWFNRQQSAQLQTRVSD